MPTRESSGGQIRKLQTLEADCASKIDRSWSAARNGGITEAKWNGRSTRILQDWINAAKVRMVEDVQHGGAELEGRTLTQFEHLGDCEVANVGEEIGRA